MILNQEQLLQAGIVGDWVMGQLDFVQYGDLDAYNHVNNKVYHAWFENIRVSYLSQSGMPFSDTHAAMPVVRSATVEFILPMFIDEDYITTVRCSRVGRSSFDLEYAVFVEGVARAKGTTSMVMADLALGKSVPLSDDMRNLFVTRDKAAT